MKEQRKEHSDKHKAGRRRWAEKKELAEKEKAERFADLS